MSFINYSSREINCKIVYYGPGLCGKTTNLQYIYNKTNPELKGKMISLATETERTLFFDFLPLALGQIRGFKTRFHLYTVPGQVFYDASRKLILKGVDGVVFVADSQIERMEANLESMDNLKEISSKINQGEGTLGALVNDRKMYDQLNAATAEAKQGAAAFQDNMEAMKHNWLLRGFFNKRGYGDSSELTEHEISNLPGSPYLKKFVFDAKKMFDKPDNAKLKSEKTLTEAGRFLEGNRFGLAIVVATNGMKGDTDEAQVLTQARAMVVRDYLVKNFKMDDTRLKTIGMGKSDQKDAVDGGSVEVIIYPVGLSMKPK